MCQGQTRGLDLQVQVTSQVAIQCGWIANASIQDEQRSHPIANMTSQMWVLDSWVLSRKWIGLDAERIVKGAVSDDVQVGHEKATYQSNCGRRSQMQVDSSLAPCSYWDRDHDRSTRGWTAQPPDRSPVELDVIAGLAGERWTCRLRH